MHYSLIVKKQAPIRSSIQYSTLIFSLVTPILAYCLYYKPCMIKATYLKTLYFKHGD